MKVKGLWMHNHIKSLVISGSDTHVGWCLTDFEPFKWAASSARQRFFNDAVRKLEIRYTQSNNWHPKTSMMNSIPTWKIPLCGFAKSDDHSSWIEINPYWGPLIHPIEFHNAPMITLLTRDYLSINYSLLSWANLWEDVFSSSPSFSMSFTSEDQPTDWSCHTFILHHPNRPLCLEHANKGWRHPNSCIFQNVVTPPSVQRHF